MNKADLAIATITWARDEAEEKLLRQSLEALAGLGMPVFISDGGSGDSFLEALCRYPHFTVQSHIRGLWPQAHNSLKMAFGTGAKFIFYTEPDKYDFFSHSLAEMIRQVTVAETTGIITASRSAEGFASFPLFQQKTETAINECCTEVLGAAADYTYGPFLLHRALVPFLDQLPEDIGWGWRPCCFGLASRLGYQVSSYEGNFFCPLEQRGDNASERLYRMRQLEQNVRGILLSQKLSLELPSGRIRSV